MHATAHHNSTQFTASFIDLNRFKNVNDTLGRTVDDQLLCTVTQRLSLQIRTSDALPARAVTNLSFCSLGSPIQMTTGQRGAQTDAGIGQTLCPGRPGTGNHAVHRYRPQFYRMARIRILNAQAFRARDVQSQAAEPQQFPVFRQEMNNRALELLILENQLRRALKREEFELFYHFYQHQVNLAPNPDRDL